jgi:hypothetical protein
MITTNHSHKAWTDKGGHVTHDDAVAVWLQSGNAIEATDKITNYLISLLEGAEILIMGAEIMVAPRCQYHELFVTIPLRIGAH